MAQGLWPNQEGVSPDLNLPQQERVDRQMIRHLLGKYSREELGRLLQEEGRVSPSSCEYFLYIYIYRPRDKCGLRSLVYILSLFNSSIYILSSLLLSSYSYLCV